MEVRIVLRVTIPGNMKPKLKLFVTYNCLRIFASAHSDKCFEIEHPIVKYSVFTSSITSSSIFISVQTQSICNEVFLNYVEIQWIYEEQVQPPCYLLSRHICCMSFKVLFITCCQNVYDINWKDDAFIWLDWKILYLNFNKVVVVKLKLEVKYWTVMYRDSEIMNKKWWWMLLKSRCFHFWSCKCIVKMEEVGNENSDEFYCNCNYNNPPQNFQCACRFKTVLKMNFCSKELLSPYNKSRL